MTTTYLPISDGESEDNVITILDPADILVGEEITRQEDESGDEVRNPAPEEAPVTHDFLYNSPRKWVTPTTTSHIRRAVGPRSNLICLHCQETRSSRKELLLHARQHWVICFCACGVHSWWHQDIGRHQANSPECMFRYVFEVDAISFLTWKRHTHIPVEDFPATRPRWSDDVPNKPTT